MLAGLRLAFLVLAFASVGDALHIRRDTSPVTLPLTRRFNTTGATKLLELDRARAKALKAGSLKGASNVFQQSAAASASATNQAVDYVTTVGLGNPPRNFTLLIDTGSSNTWVGARPLENPVIPTGLTGNVVSVEYGSGFVTGLEMTNSITVGSGLTIENQSMGAALISAGFTDVDGILGLGPTDLTCGTLLLGGQCIPTVTDNAFSQGLIPERLVGFSFEPSASLDNPNGELTFGGVDPSKFIGPLNFVPITSASPANQFVGIDQSITFGSPIGETVLPLSAGITDTGTTLLLIASDAFATYQSLTGGVIDPASGLLSITPEQFANLKSLFFNIGGNTFEFTPNAQIWPRALNSVISGADDSILLVINDIGSVTGEGLDFIDGMTFLERFYYVFDSENSRVGLAPTPFTHAMTN